MPREILVDWTTDSGGGKVSVFWFLTASAVADQRASLATFLQAVDNALATTCSWVIRTTGREVDDATGTLTGVWTDGTTRQGSGTGTGEPVADATQVLIRWATDHIVNGRFLKGRTYIPGLVSDGLVNGNLDPATQTSLTTAAQALVASGEQLAVWHRPVAGSGGVAWAVDAGSVWGELAVLRRRRG